MNVPYFEVTAVCDNERCATTEFKGQRKRVEKINTADGPYIIDHLVCPQCRSWGKITKIVEVKNLRYGDGVAVELGDQIEVNDDPDFEPEAAIVIKIGKGSIRIQWKNKWIKPHTQFVKPEICELVRREA